MLCGEWISRGFNTRGYGQPQLEDVAVEAADRDVEGAMAFETLGLPTEPMQGMGRRRLPRVISTFLA